MVPFVIRLFNTVIGKVPVRTENQFRYNPNCNCLARYLHNQAGGKINTIFGSFNSKKSLFFPDWISKPKSPFFPSEVGEKLINNRKVIMPDTRITKTL